MHYFQNLVGQRYQSVCVIADKTYFDSGVYGRREFEQRGAGNGIGVVLFHIAVQMLFIFFGVLAVCHLHQQIGKVGFGPNGSRCQIVAQRGAAEGN